MKEVQCVVPGCQWKTRAEDEAEVVRRTSEHLRGAHGETMIRESTIENIKKHIHDAEHA